MSSEHKTDLSFRLKLTLNYALSFLVILFIFCTVVCGGLQQVLFYQLNQGLLVIARSEVAFSTHSARIHLHDTPSMGDPLQRFIQITNINGQTIIASKDLKKSTLPLSRMALKQNANGERIFEDVTYQEQPFRILYFPFKKNGQNYSLQVATPLTSLHQIMTTTMQIFWLVGLLMLAIATFIGYFLAGRAVRPILEITETARQISHENLKARIPTDPEEHDELAQLKAVMNDMLDRLAHAFETLQQFTSDAAHELNTPLTILKGEIQVALRKPRSEEAYRQLLESNLEEVNRLIRLTDALLMLEREEQSECLEQSPCDLNQLVNLACERYQPRVLEQQVKLQIILSPTCMVQGQDEKLLRVIYNLLENAIEASPAGSTVRVETIRNNGHVCLRIQDQGHGIAPEEQQRIFQRFYRSDQSRTHSEGHFGIGLSICKAIVKNHGGTIAVQSIPNQGSIFTVSLSSI